MWWLVGLAAALTLARSNNWRNGVVHVANLLPGSQSRTLLYRSRDGGAFFRFRFCMHGHGVRIYVLESPSSRPGACHLLSGEHGRYICWSGAINSMAAAKRVAAMWAEATLVYQRTGQTF